MVPEGLRHGKDGRIRRRIRTAHDGDVGAAKVGAPFKHEKNVWHSEEFFC